MLLQLEFNGYQCIWDVFHYLEKRSEQQLKALVYDVARGMFAFCERGRQIFFSVGQQFPHIIY